MKELILNAIKFTTKAGNQYLYDGVSGVVYPVDNIMSDCIVYIRDGVERKQIYKNLLDKYNEDILVQGAMAQVYKIVENEGLFIKKKDTSKAKRLTCKDITDKLIDMGGTFQLILNVTEDCNLRCKYCYLSETYDYTRNRTCKKMSFETAKKAMDYFFRIMKKIKRFNPGKKCAITFYGGEPLLEFEFIKSCVKYAVETSPVNLIFSITTNGTLLTNEVSDFLVKHDFFIGVSLDGSKSNHNRNRVFENGEGTFDIVFANIKNFSKRYPQYFKLSLMVVVDYKTDLKENEDFFAKTNLPRIAFLTMVASWNTSYYQQFSEQDYKRYYEEYNFLLEKYISDKIDGVEILPFSKALIELSLCDILIRPKKQDKKYDFLPYTGACLPGSKVSVRTTGEYDICERVNETIPIGDSTRGIVYSDVIRLVEKYNDIVTNGCAGCPIQKSCSVCYAQCCGNGTFEKIECRGMLNTFIEKLSIVYSILEKNPSAFDEFLLPVEILLSN